MRCIRVLHARAHRRTLMHTKERTYHEHPLRTYSTENCFALIVISLNLSPSLATERAAANFGRLWWCME